MLYLRPQPLDSPDDLRAALANAITLELATIPPYLTALFSIKPGANAAAGAIVRSVVIEEMLHLSLACNLLNAVGGTPDLPGSVRTYPTPLPMDIGSEPGQTFCVPLSRLTVDTVRDVFMVIEEPDDPIVFPEQQRLAAIEPEYHTIGDFYRAVLALIESLSPGIFTPDLSRQVTGWVGTDRLHAVVDLDTASRAINLIIDQGEGTTTTPVSGPDELAHYYRFEQIQRGESLVLDPAAPDGFAWGQPGIPLDDSGVWPMTLNPPGVPLPEGSEVAFVSDQFDATFTTLVDDLQRTFTGEPGLLGAAMAQMHALRLEAQRLMPLSVPGTAETAGPRFLYAGRLERDARC